MSRENIPDDGQLLRADVPLLFPSPTNPRKIFPEADLMELAESIKSLGIMQPILVRPLPAEIKARVSPLADNAELEIVAGERRWRAAQLAGLSDVPILLRHLEDRTVICMQVVENLQRENLNFMDEAEGFGQLQAQGMSVDEIAQSVGKGMSKAYVYAKLKLLDLCPEVREQVRNGATTESIAVLIARIPVPEMQADALALVTERDEYTGDPMSFRKARTLISERYTRNLAKAPFDPSDASLLPEAGACGDCPHFLANHPGADSSANVCTRPPCHESKRQAHNVRLLALPEDTPRIEVPKIEGTTGTTNWTDYDAAGYRQLTSAHQTDPKRRSYADWLKDNNEEVPLAIHIDPASGDARIVARTNDLIRAANRIEAKAAAIAGQQRLDAIDTESEDDGADSPAPTTQAAPARPISSASVQKEDTAPKAASRATPAQSANALAYARYKASLSSAILAEPPMMIAGPMLHIVARALSGSYAPIASDGEAVQIILSTLTKRAADKPVASESGLEAIADALSINYADLLDEHIPVPEGCVRPNEHGVYPKQHKISHGQGKTNIHIYTAQTAGGWRASTEIEGPDGGRSGPITDLCDGYPTEQEAVAAIVPKFTKEIAQSSLIPSKARDTLIWWLNRIADDATGTHRNPAMPYRHPENSAICWSGKGRKPQWVLDWIEQGKSLADLENPDYRREAA